VLGFAAVYAGAWLGRR